MIVFSPWLGATTSTFGALVTCETGVKSFDDLPRNAQAYLRRLEVLVGAPISIISTGPDRTETIVLKHPFD